MEIVEYGGWKRCARLVSGDVEAIVTLDVGPRVIRLGFAGGRNELHESPKDMGKTGGSEYRSYGGHRLWIAPEDADRTFQPENEPVSLSEVDGWAVFSIPADKNGLRKELRIRAHEQGGFFLEHYVHNDSSESATFAPWALTVMAPGGQCVFPQAPFQPHSSNFLPVRPLVLWSYTDMADPRYFWGTPYVVLRQDPSMGPQKVGSMVEQGWAAYQNGGNLFLKRFGFEPGATYPDMGCNFETFTRQDMLEVESLGPLVTLEAGGVVRHDEAWYLMRDVGSFEEIERLAMERPLSFG